MLDWGKRGSLSRERTAQEDAATIGAGARARSRVGRGGAVHIESPHAPSAEQQVARAALEAHRAEFTIARDRAARGLTPAAALAGSEADVAESEARALAADLQVRIAHAELRRAIGG